jgi:WD40 repeat protein
MPLRRVVLLLLCFTTIPAAARAQSGTLGVFHPSNKYTVVSTGLDGAAVFELSTGQRVAVLEAISASEVAVSADGQHVAIAATNGIALYSFQTRQFVRLLNPTPPAGFKPGSGNRVTFVGSTLAALYRGIGYAFDPSTGKQVGAWIETAMAANNQVGVVGVLAGNPAAMTVASGNHSQLTVREAVSGKQIWRKDLDAPSGRTRPELKSAAFSPDGTLLVTGHSDGFVRFWNAATGELQDVRPVSKAEVLSVAISPNGRQLATVDSAGRAETWSVVSGEAMGGAQNEGALSVSFSPNGAQISVPVRSGKHQLYTIDTDDSAAKPKTPDLNAAGLNEGGASATRQPEWLLTKALIEISQYSLVAAEETSKSAPKTSTLLDRFSVSAMHALANAAKRIPEIAAAAVPLGAAEATLAREARSKIVQTFAAAADRASRVNNSNRMSYLVGEHAGDLRVLLLMEEYARQAGEKFQLPAPPEQGLTNLITQTDIRKADLPADLVENIKNLRGLTPAVWAARLDAIIGIDLRTLP